MSKKDFLFNPNNPKKSFDVYIDKNPKDTINIKYTTIKDVENTIKKLEKLYKNGKYPHKRIYQVAMIMYVRLNAIKKYKNTKYKNAKFVNERVNLALKYKNFLNKRTKIKNDIERKKYKFII
jgi:tRNA U34 5-carboxymethylaminomethyl modifying enzyme MnmG/GidA